MHLSHIYGTTPGGAVATPADGDFRDHIQVMLPPLTLWQTPEHCQSPRGSCVAPQRAEHSSGTLDLLIKDLSTPFPCQQFIYIIVQAVLNYNTGVENIPWQTWSWYINP